MPSALLIINSQSGSGKGNEKIIKYIKNYFLNTNYNLDIFETKVIGDVYNYLSTHSLPESILIMGGDGTINHLINDLMLIKEQNNLPSSAMPKILILSCGTSNDISKILGLPKTLHKRLQLLTGKKSKLVDINRINDQYFFFCSAYGFLTDVSYTTPQTLKQKYGYLAYLNHGLKQIKKYKDFSLTVKCQENITVVNDAFLILVLAGNEFGSFKINQFDKKTKLNDGLIELRVFSKSKVSKLTQVISFILRGGKKQKNEIHLQADQFEIEILDNNISSWNIDGEAGPKTKKVTYSVIKCALPFYIGSKAHKLF